MPNVLCLLPEARFKQSQVHFPAGVEVSFCTDYGAESIIESAQDVKIIFCPPSFPRITAEIISKLTHIQLIQSAGTGFDSIDHEAASKFGIPVANSPNMNNTSVAEHVFMFITALQRNVMRSDQAIKSGRYGTIRDIIMGEGVFEIMDSVIGIVGMGAIGRTVAVQAQDLNAKVVGFDPFWPDSFAQERNIVRLDLHDLMKTADTVTIHCPLLPETRGLIGETELRLMKPQAILINTARGGVVDEAALASILESGHLRGAAVDNFESEVPTPNNPLLNLSPAARERVIFTPHIAGATRQAFTRMLRQGAENIARVIAGQKAKFVVNGVK